MKTPNPLLSTVVTNVEHCVWPPLPQGQAAILTTVLQQLERSQWLPTAQIVQQQHAKLLALANFAHKYSPHFRARLEKAGLSIKDLATPAGLRRLPLLTRQDVQQAGKALGCTAVPKHHQPLGEGKSSGSTGQPVTITKTAVNAMMWNANMMREHFWHKRNFSGRIMNIRAKITEMQMQNGWGAPVSILYASGQVLAVPIIFSAEQMLKTILEFKPHNIVIYPNTMDAIVTLCEKQQIKIPVVEHVWSIGETLKPELRARIQAVFVSARIEDDYSCNELGIMALQCPESGLYHVMAESVIIEVLDEEGKPCAPGQVGKVAVTDLHNYATPMVRYEIGDYAEVGPPCSCGRGLPTLKAIKGRKRNLVVKPDGSRHWPPLTLHVFGSGLPIRQFQLVQHALDDIEVRLVTEPKLSPTEEEKLTEYLYKALDYTCPLRFVYFQDKLPQPANGKFEDFISHV